MKPAISSAKRSVSESKSCGTALIWICLATSSSVAVRWRSAVTLYRRSMKPTMSRRILLVDSYSSAIS